jgi:hypothetical protein
MIVFLNKHSNAFALDHYEVAREKGARSVHLPLLLPAPPPLPCDDRRVATARALACLFGS